MDFTAIDFETANSQRSSACAVGIAVVRDGQIVDVRSWLIRPEPLEFDGWNVMIHGITEADVGDAGTFGDVWPEVLSSLEGDLILAHNAAFDMSVLRHSLAQFGNDNPELAYFCTRTLAKLAYPGWLSYTLPAITEQFRIAFDHHDPESDAVACAQVALRICAEAGADSVAAALDHFSVRPGRLYPGGYQSWQYPTATGLRPQDLVPESDEFDPLHPFYGRLVVFTGALESMVRAQAMQLVVNAGGQCGNSVTKKTNFLVVGEQDYRRLRGDTMSAKVKRADQLRRQGMDVEVLPESEFIQLLYS